MASQAGAVELFALRKMKKRPATVQEIETTRPFYKKGIGEKGKTGILLIHGFTVTPANFRGFADALASDGYTVSLPLLPGHGGTPDELLEVTWQDWLAEVVKAYDALRAECSEVFVAGISLGGALALQLATQRRDMKKLFLLAPAVYPIPLLKVAIATLVPLLARLGLKYWMHVAGDVKRPDGFELGYGKTALNGLFQLSACMKETQKILPDVKADVLVFQGRTDHEVPAPMVVEILHLLGSERKDLVWLDNSFHEIPRDYEAGRVLERIRSEMAKQ